MHRKTMQPAIISANAGNGSKTGENSDEESDAQSSRSEREIEIQSGEKLPLIVRDDGAGSSRELKIQNGYFGGVNTKARALKGTDDAPSGDVCDINKLQVFSPENNVVAVTSRRRSLGLAAAESALALRSQQGVRKTGE